VTKVKDKQTEHHRISNHSPLLRKNGPFGLATVSQ